MPISFTISRDYNKPLFKWIRTAITNGDPTTKFSFAFEQPYKYKDKETKKEVKYRGLRFEHTVNDYGVQYKPDDYKTEHPYWAYFIYPTVLGESEGYFNALNTYDRAYFTFGFVQMTVQHAGDNFTKLLRALLSTPKATDYFPDLVLRKVNTTDYIHQKVNTTFVQLESDKNNKLLREYLNPQHTAIDDAELLAGARLAHWATNDPEHRKIQVGLFITQLKEKLKNTYSRQMPLDGLPDTICLVVCDLRHQNRATPETINKTLKNGQLTLEQKYEKLVNIGSKTESFKKRVKTLNDEIKKLVDAGILGKKKYDKASGEFV